MMQAREAQWSLAEHSFQRAIGIAPRDALWRDHFALFVLLPLGRIEEALNQLYAAEEIDPASFQTHFALSIALRAAARWTRRKPHCQKAAANDPTAWCLLESDSFATWRRDQAIRILEATWNGHLLDPGAQSLGIAYARAGRREDAERIASPSASLCEQSTDFRRAGRQGRTFRALDQMVSMGPTRIEGIFSYPRILHSCMAIHGFTALRKKLALPE